MSSPLIHAARIQGADGRKLLLLRKKEPNLFVWMESGTGGEVETEVFASEVEEAIRLAARRWKHEEFSPFNCGFRYTLPERDEHGTNALFHQMAASYSVPNGVYFDEELGSNCFVQGASDEARNLLQQLRKENLL